MQFIYHHRTAGRGAEGNHIMSLVRALEAQGHEVTIISPLGVDPCQTAGGVPLDKGATQQRGIGRLWRWITCHCPQIFFECLEIGYNFYAFLRLFPVLSRNRSAIYYERHAFFLVAGILAARWFGLPAILEVNEVAGIQRARKQILVRLSLWMAQLAFHRADRIVVVSSFLRDRVIQLGARPDSVVVIPNAIDPQRFRNTPSSASIRNGLGLNGSVVIGFVGWFDKWDRLDLLLDVMASLLVELPELRLVLVGDGPVAAELRAKIDRLGLKDHVTLTGPVARNLVPAYIDAMEICVLPDSNPYGSPMVLIEFMAMGKAVIAPDLMPIRDVIRHGENGYVIAGGCREQLRHAVLTLAGDASLRRRLGARAQRDILENRTWDATAHQVASMFSFIDTPNRSDKELVG